MSDGIWVMSDELTITQQPNKALGSTIYFPSSPLNQTHSKKVSLPIFSPKFSIHTISPPNKHTLSFFLSCLIFGQGPKMSNAVSLQEKLFLFNWWHRNIHLNTDILGETAEEFDIGQNLRRSRMGVGHAYLPIWSRISNLFSLAIIFWSSVSFNLMVTRIINMMGQWGKIWGGIDGHRRRVEKREDREKYSLGLIFRVGFWGKEKGRYLCFREWEE